MLKVHRNKVENELKNDSRVSGIGTEGARESRTGKVPERSPTTRKYLTKAIWLNNNRLTTTENMDELVESLLEQPQKLGWIDFSFNYITTIDEVSNSIINSIALTNI